MAPEVFLSYSREDQATARRYAQALEQEGFRVWWDAALNPGETFDKVTEQALRDAKAVVVLWSKRSVESRWVRSEATQADRYGKLVPVAIEPCDRPILFELSHTTDLSAWKGDRNEPDWRNFVASVRRQTQQDGGGGTRNGMAPLLPAPAVAAGTRGRLALAAGAIALLLAVGGAFWALQGNNGAAPAPAPAAAMPAAASTAPGIPVTSVAVMPFANLTGDPDKDFFGDGMAEELINALAQVGGLQVASRTSSFAYKGSNTDVRAIAKELGVATVIEGSVRSAGDRIRLTAQLINADSGYHLWSETYDRDFRDLFKLQDELTREIVSAYRRTMGVDLRGLGSQKQPTASLDAYMLYLRGLHALGTGTDAGTREAMSLAEQAIALDPQFARAYWGLAIAHSLLQNSSTADIERAAQRANELDAGLGGELLAMVAARRGEWLKAEEGFRGINVEASNLYATSTLWPTGRLREALRMAERADQLAPASSTIANTLARLNALLGDAPQARRWHQASLDRGSDPAGRRTNQALYDLAVMDGRYDEAADLIIGFLTPNMRGPQGEAAVRLAHRAMGDAAQRPAAIAALDAWLAKAGAADWTIRVFAQGWYSTLGALDQAYALAESLHEQLAVSSSLGNWAWLWGPQMSAFRRDARFQPYVTRLGMMPVWEKFGPPDGCTLEAGRLTCS